MQQTCITVLHALPGVALNSKKDLSKRFAIRRDYGRTRISVGALCVSIDPILKVHLSGTVVGK